MARNGTILQRRAHTNKTIENRAATINKWRTYLTELYAAREVPDFPADHEIHNINIADKLNEAIDLNFTTEEVRQAV